MRTLPNGPIAPDAFRWHGKLYEGMRPTAWRLVRHLWDAPNNAAGIDALAFPVFELHDPPLRHQYAPAATRANKFFIWHALPFTVRSRNRCLQLVRRPE